MSAAVAYAPIIVNRGVHLHPLSLNNAPTKALVGASLKGYSLHCIIFRTATDPAMGTGNFFSSIPEHIRDKSNLHGIELDQITGRIAKLLYPSADIRIQGFEYSRIQDATYDVIVGNVPFGDFNINDRTYGRSYLIHDYFFIKSLDKLKPGGVLALITSAGTMDKANAGARHEMNRRAEFIGAVRLPVSAFKTAGTSTTTDIIFLQKREQILSSDRYDLWTKNETQYRTDFFINSFFAKNPENIIGELKSRSGPHGRLLIECILEAENQQEEIQQRLNERMGAFKASFSAEPTVHAADDTPFGETYDSETEIPENIRPYTFYQSGGILYYAEGRLAVPYNGTAQQTKRLGEICGIAESLQRLIDLQLANDGDIESERALLNSLYDGFVSKYGYLSSRTNSSIFADDVRQPLLLSCEEATDEKEYAKADIFSKNTVQILRKPERVQNALEALHISLNLRQKVDIRYMAELIGAEPDDVISNLSNQIFLNPLKYNGGAYDGWETAEEYLSGRTKDKLEVARAYAQTEPALFYRNVSALLEHQPQYIRIEDIGFSLGTIYIPAEMYRQFMYETFETPLFCQSLSFNQGSKSVIDVVYLNALNEWQVSNKSSDHSVKANEIFGTGRINAYAILEQSLNQRKVEIKDPVVKYRNGNETVTYVINRKETLLAREKQSRIESEFRQWILGNAERVKRIESIYNDKYNVIVPRNYDGSYLGIPGLNGFIQLKAHQKDVVARIVSTGTAMMAHEVGAGKTAAMASAGMYLKQIGAINKAIYVVPKPIVGQWSTEFMRFFPGAHILVTSERDFEKKNRQRFLSKISTGNYDAVIMSHSQFEKIPLSLPRQERIFERKIDEISMAVAELEREKGNRFSVKQMVASRKKLETKLEKLRADFKKDNFITFEELGCDFLFVDEAHAYKNLPLFTKMHNVAGINTASSQRAVDMEMKVRYMQEINNGGGVVFATGTPISNTLSELFTMQYYLQPDILRELNIDYFDNWASVYGKMVSALEIKPSGEGFRMRTRFASFHNLPELCNIFSEVFDIRRTADLDLKLPSIAGGKPDIIVCEKSPEQEEQTEIGLARAEAIEKKRVTPDEDNMLAVCTYMTKVALDGRINNPEADDYEGSKVNLCAKSIIKIAAKHPETAQVVFCDSNVPSADTTVFSVYREIKARLIESEEFKPDEVAFIHDYDTDKKRAELFELVNKAEIRVVIGSTGKLGTGVNMQQRLIAAHHLDAPYRPADIEQRNGRLVRQGNQNDEVYIRYYSTKGTFDSYRWQLLEKKQAFISQIMSGKPVSRSCEDIDEATLTYSEMKAATTGDPLIAEKLQLDNEVSRLQLLQSDWIESQRKLEHAVKVHFPNEIANCQKRLESIRADLEHLRKNPYDHENFRIAVDGKIYSERAEANKAIQAAVMAYKADKEKSDNCLSEKIGEFNGFELMATSRFGSFEMTLSLKLNSLYSTDYILGVSSGAVKLENLMEKLPKYEKEIAALLDSAQNQLKSAAAELGKPFKYTEELTRLSQKQAAINAELEFSDIQEDEVVQDDELEM